MITLQEATERILHAQGVNVSRSGVCCSTLEKIAPGTSTYLVLELQHGGVRRISAEGIVVWCDPHDTGYDTGVVFRTLYENSARALDQFLSPKEKEILANKTSQE